MIYCTAVRTQDGADNQTRQVVAEAWQEAIVADDGINLLVDPVFVNRAEQLSAAYYRKRYGAHLTFDQVQLLQREHAVNQIIRTAFSAEVTPEERAAFGRALRLMYHQQTFGAIGIDEFALTAELIEGMGEILHGVHKPAG